MRTVLLRTVPFFFLLTALVGCDAVNGPAPTDAATSQTEDVAAVATPDETALIPGRYIVVVSEKGVAQSRASARADLRALTDEVTARGAIVRHTYEHALTGFAAAMSAEEAEALMADSRVLYVEQERRAYLNGTGTQGGVTWGIDRVNARSGLDGQYGWRASGEGVTAYVIDTGIRITHNEFGGRASYGYDFRDNDPVASDCNGHGTHVAGTIGGATYGMAKDVDLVAVRVFGCGNFGNSGDIIAGFDWVAANAQLPAVANASLTVSDSPASRAATQSIVDAGVAFAVAAGNGYGANACNYTPARVADVMTVGSTDSSDRRSSFSNVGSCIDFFAPGSSVTSAWYNSDSATNTISGTSMASPHVAGAAAMLLEVKPNFSPERVRNIIYNFTTKNAVSNSNTANNHLLYNGGNPNGIALTDDPAFDL